jgi:beta-glucosidase
MGRHAQGGRNWEGFGLDPYLAGLAMNATVSGIEYIGVQTCSKHFIGNEQENQRTRSVSANGTIIEALSSNIDDRTLLLLSTTHTTPAQKHSLTKFKVLFTSNTSGRLQTLSKLRFTRGTASYANAGLDLEMPGDVSALYGAS